MIDQLTNRSIDEMNQLSLYKPPVVQASPACGVCSVLTTLTTKVCRFLDKISNLWRGDGHVYLLRVIVNNVDAAACCTMLHDAVDR